MKIKYVRCSTINQNLDRQLADKENYDLIFEEKISGKSKTNRTELQNMLKSLRSGDEVFCHSIDRLARNTLDLLTIIKEIKDKDCSITFIKEGWTFSNKENFANKTQELMLTIMEPSHRQRELPLKKGKWKELDKHKKKENIKKHIQLN